MFCDRFRFRGNVAISEKKSRRRRCGAAVQVQALAWTDCDSGKEFGDERRQTNERTNERTNDDERRRTTTNDDERRRTTTNDDERQQNIVGGSFTDRQGSPHLSRIPQYQQVQWFSHYISVQLKVSERHKEMSAEAVVEISTESTKCISIEVRTCSDRFVVCWRWNAIEFAGVRCIVRSFVPLLRRSFLRSLLPSLPLLLCSLVAGQ